MNASLPYLVTVAAILAALNLALACGWVTA